jgi:hypothetical protein
VCVLRVWVHHTSNKSKIRDATPISGITGVHVCVYVLHARSARNSTNQCGESPESVRLCRYGYANVIVALFLCGMWQRTRQTTQRPGNQKYFIFVSAKCL